MRHAINLIRDWHNPKLFIEGRIKWQIKLTLYRKPSTVVRGSDFNPTVQQSELTGVGATVTNYYRTY